MKLRARNRTTRGIPLMSVPSLSSSSAATDRCRAYVYLRMHGWLLAAYRVVLAVCWQDEIGKDKLGASEESGCRLGLEQYRV
jgi:hypothetical protein